MTPGPISQRSPGPREETPYVPSWCFPKGPHVCPCGHHEGYHGDSGICVLTAYCRCTGLPDACRTPASEMIP